MLQEQNNHRILRYLAVFVFFVFGGLVLRNTSDFQASLFPTKQAPPYDGLALPVQKVPNWISLSSDKWVLDYSVIPADKLMSLPTYDPTQLKIPYEQLSLTKEPDRIARNAKITFSTPYMGNYKLDGVEYAGSHLAVDIKIPRGTPIFAIGNGIVVKVSTLNVGFGNHIVIQHDQFPAVNDPNMKVTYYSSYSHLGSVLVSEGDVVTRGQQLGLSGSSGEATTPHLHFQIDNDQAPWHPYWPFTYADAHAAGLDFNSAVNAGLGKDKALATTINPLVYVQKYLTSAPVVNAPVSVPVTPAPTPAPETASTSPAPTPTPSPTPAVQVTPLTSLHGASDQVATSSNTPLPPPEAPKAAKLKIVTDATFVVGVDEKIKVEAIDDKGSIAANYNPPSGVSVLVGLGGAQIRKNYLLAQDFKSGVAETVITPTAPQGLRLQAIDGTISGESEIMQSILFTDVGLTDPYYKAVKFLKDSKVIDGYKDGTYKPNAVVSRVEALKLILKGLALKIQKVGRLPFKDVSLTQWYADYIATGFNMSVIAGYKDRSFKPAQTVNRAEFLKMVLKAMNVTPDQKVETEFFMDVPRGSWYAPYVQYAVQHGLIDVAGDSFGPEEGMTRKEVAELIYRVVVLQISGAQKYTGDLTVTAEKANQYFGL